MNIDKIIDEYKEEIIKSTQYIIQIPSVEEKPEKGKPFGDKVDKALKYALNLCEGFGFKVENFDGYAGHAEIGNGEETVGILVHLDVVPEGDGWTYPPYGGEIYDGKIYGRGAIDDKGPAISIIYAMKAIKELEIPINKKIRVIFGTNEETRWEDMDYYFKKNKAPNIGFTPDADFPAIYGEMGILDFEIIKNIENKEYENINIEKLQGGNRPNMVPDNCEAVLKVKENYKESLINKLNKYIKNSNSKFELVDDKNVITIKSRGISAHGSTPQSGKNAISQLMVLLDQIVNEDNDICKFIKFYKEKIGINYNGENIGCGFEDDLSGKLVFNVGTIEYREDKVITTVNVRYPITYNVDDVYNGIKKELESIDAKIIEKGHMRPIYISKDHELIQKLMKVYRDETGDVETEPITIGGGTYARAMDNAVAFGPLFPGQKELAHQKDEYIEIEHLIKITKIYTKALYELTR
ncbi:dipeptidase [Gottschalkia purinilytica]|uniref:Dipeptidase n=1 Tax=Gottschalkia purinilytica TaxID=1503 RepID=A0A0L0W7S6_GOTPU|nr:dipeptidase PepV [Gottschalkia purinilytica]KNF07482.1 dipeptidase [Gottschalkia purinilytica]